MSIQKSKIVRNHTSKGLFVYFLEFFTYLDEASEKEAVCRTNNTNLCRTTQTTTNQ